METQAAIFVPVVSEFSTQADAIFESGLVRREKDLLI
jgi:hypothetical protein